MRPLTSRAMRVASARATGPRRIRGGSGLGDALYVRPVADYFARQSEAVQVLSFYPDVFLGSGAQVLPFDRVAKVDTIAHYAPGRRNPDTTQWQEVCRSAGIAEPLPFRFGWRVQNEALVHQVRARAAKRPIVLVHGGREPFGRMDQFGIELLPDPRGFEAALGALRECFLVRIGRGKQFYKIRSDLDLYGETSVGDVLDLAWSCEGIVAQCSFAVPLAEAFDKPLLALWAARGLASKQRYISGLTPQKVLQGERSRHVVDDWPGEKIVEAARAFREL